MCISRSLAPVLGLVGVIVGWGLNLLTRRFDEVSFGAKLVIDGQKAPGNKDETADKAYMRFCVRNTTARRVAKNCRAYVVELYKITTARSFRETCYPIVFNFPGLVTISSQETFPAKVTQYVNVVSFSKHTEGWNF